MCSLVYRRLEVASLELETTIGFKRYCNISVITAGIYIIIILCTAELQLHVHCSAYFF